MLVKLYCNHTQNVFLCNRASYFLCEARRNGLKPGRQVLAQQIIPVSTGLYTSSSRHDSNQRTLGCNANALTTTLPMYCCKELKSNYAIYIDGTQAVLAIGGYYQMDNINAVALNTVKLYNTATNTWTTLSQRVGTAGQLISGIGGCVANNW